MQASLTPGTARASGRKFMDGAWQEIDLPVPQELSLAIYVNGKELVSILCTPLKLNCLVVGFLYSEGIISSAAEIASMRVCIEDSLADVRLDTTPVLPERRTITSGCGGGVKFESLAGDLPRLESTLSVSPAAILSLMRQMNEQAETFRASGGVHASALADDGDLIVVAEDIGRHNTLDKILGECLLRKLPTKDRLLLTTGRVSSEMLLKAARMATPIVVSRSSPTDRSIALAERLGITLVGYARSTRLTVYSHPQRVR